MEVEENEILLECTICMAKGNFPTSIHNLSIKHEDGTIIQPMEVLLRITNLDLDTSQTSKCCGNCLESLHRLAILDRTLTKVKEEILSKMKPILSQTKVKEDKIIKSCNVNQHKRTTAKSKRYHSQQSDPEDNDQSESDKKMNIVEAPDDMWPSIEQVFELKNKYFRDYFDAHIAPKHPGTLGPNY